MSEYRNMKAIGGYVINGERFDSKQKIKERIRNISEKYNDYEPIKEDDKIFLIEILKYHPEFEEKMQGMTDMVFSTSNYYNGRNRCMFILYGEPEDELEDRPMDDISWTICLSNIPVSCKIKTQFKFNFGKYKGKTIQEVYKLDQKYLKWISEGEFDDRSVKIKVGQFLKYGYIPYNPISQRNKKLDVKPKPKQKEENETYFFEGLFI